MKIITVTHSRNKIHKLIDETSASSEPIHITGKRNNAVLRSEDDRNSLQESLLLTSIPGMKKSIF